MKSIVDVLVPAATYDLITLGDALLELQISNPTYADEALISKQIAGISAAIAKYCDRVFPSEKVEETIFNPRSDLRSGYGYGGLYQYSAFDNRNSLSSFYTRRYPITSIDSIYVDDVLLDVDSNDASLRIDRENGVLYKLQDGVPCKWWFGKAIVITYTGGYLEIPEDLQRVASRWVEMAWFAAGNDATIKSETVYNIASVSYGTGGETSTTSGGGVSVPDEIKLYLEPYIRPWGFA